MRPKPCLLPLVAVCALVGSTVAVAGQRAFVATYGIDNPGCSPASPCRSFNAAIAAVASGGEVVVLDSGGYGVATIGKSVSLVAPAGVYAGVTAFLAEDGIRIDGAGIAVVLHGLTINGLGGTNGITIANAATVRVENCVVSNFTSVGIDHTAGMLYVEDTTVRDNGSIGIWSVGSVKARLDRVRLDENLEGVRAQNDANVVVHDSVMTRNSGDGAVAFGGASNSTPRLVVSHSLMSYNQRGGAARSAVTGAGADVLVTDSTVTRNVAEGLLTSKFDLTGGALMRVVGTTSMLNGAMDLRISDFSNGLLYRSSLMELEVDHQASLDTGHDSDVFNTSAVQGTVNQQPPF
jgi:hypothetical protein